jgi:hypothetical protein
MSTRTKAAITLAAGLLVIAAALLAVLLQSPRKVTGSNGITTVGELTGFHRHTVICQGGEVLPASTEAVRVSIAAYIGPAISMTVSHGGQSLAVASRGRGWVSSSLTLALRPSLTAPTEVTLCLRRDNSRLVAGVLGNATIPARAATVNAIRLPGRMRVEYLAAGEKSWLSLAHHVARRMGLGHDAPSGGWTVVPLALLMLCALALAGWLIVRTE